MKPFLFAVPCCALALLMVPGMALGAANPAPVAKEPATPAKSVFVNDPAFGKDPFFPKSVRRPLPVTNILARANPLAAPSGVPEEIVLKGINLLKSRRFAIINNVTVAQGEECELKIKGRLVRLLCLEVKEKSVVVSVGGTTKEIPLRSGL